MIWYFCVLVQIIIYFHQVLLWQNTHTQIKSGCFAIFCVFFFSLPLSLTLTICTFPINKSFQYKCLKRWCLKSFSYYFSLHNAFLILLLLIILFRFSRFQLNFLRRSTGGGWHTQTHTLSFHHAFWACVPRKNRLSAQFWDCLPSKSSCNSEM